MKKILMTASESSHFKNFHIPYIKYMQERGCRVFTASRGGPALDGVEHTTLNFRKKLFHAGNIGVILKLSRLIRKNGFDTVYTNSTLAGFIGRAAVILSRRKRTKTVHICHGYLFSDDGSLRSRVYLFFERLVRKRTDILAVMNREDMEIAEKYSLGKRIVFINGMGVESRKFPRVQEEEIRKMQSRLGRRGDEMLFLCVGEFSPRKNQKTIIEACAGLEGDYRMVFAGDGRELEACRQLCEKLGVTDRTVFLGHFENMNLLYRSCHCLISASRFEGLPFNVMEALYCGEDIIVSDVKGNNDLAREHGGMIYPYSDAAGLTELMNGQLLKGAENEAQSRLAEKYLSDKVLPENVKFLEINGN